MSSTQSVTRPPMEQPTPGQSTAMQTSNRVPEVIRNPDDYRQTVTRWHQQQYHVLSPVANFSGIPAHFGLVATRVEINPDPEQGEVYQDRLFCEGDEVAIAKPGLSKIAQAAGMTIKTERADPRTIPHFWEVRATAIFIGLDGTPQSIDATAEYDLRDGSPRVEKMKAAARKHNRDATAQILGARTFGLRGAEARAINAAIRQFGIRQKYTKAELAKPFVMVRVVHLPDMSDAPTRQQVTAAALAGSTALFGSSPAAAALPKPELIDVIGVGAPPPKEERAPAPPPDPTRQILRVEHDPSAGVTDITLDGGELVVTSRPDVAAAAFAAQQSKRDVLVTMGERDGRPEVTKIEIKDGPKAEPKGEVKL